MSAKIRSTRPSNWPALLLIVTAILAPAAAATKGAPGSNGKGEKAHGKQDASQQDAAVVAEPAAAPDPAAVPTATPPDASAAASGATGRYIVVLKGSADPGAVAQRHTRSYGAQVAQLYGSALKGYAAVVPAKRLDALRADADVEFVAADARIEVAEQTTGTGVRRINAAAKANRGAGVNVAVIDTGIDTSHPDLAANVAGGVNCAGGGKRNYSDGHGHGTHVAGIVAALDNGNGVVGVAPEAKLWGVRVLDDNGWGWTSWLVCGIDFVDSESPARGGSITVANMSLGGIGADDGNCGKTNADAMHYAVCRAVADGVTFVAAAGNYGIDLSAAKGFVPAAYDEVIAVSALADSDGRPCGAGSTTKYATDDTFASFSNYASSAADLAHLVAAPGVNIYSTYKGGGYTTFSGTSMASPHVAGGAALYVAAHPGASPASVLAALKAVAEPSNTDFNGECAGGASKRGGKGGGGGRASHTDPSSRHPEPVLRAESL